MVIDGQPGAVARWSSDFWARHIKRPYEFIKHPHRGSSFTPSSLAVLRATGKRPKLVEARQPGKAAHFTAQERS